jgi:Fur family peroxide stress response transcriptional regulator
MNPEPKDIQQRLERFEQVLRTAGVRLTPQRLEIFREVAQAGDHPDAETVFRRLRKRMPTVSLDTVYRTLWLLNDHGLITTLGTARERTRFDANLVRHHHFVCTRCGLTRDFYSEDLDDLQLPSAARAFGKIETTVVEVRGVCRECAGKKSSTRSS